MKRFNILIYLFFLLTLLTCTHTLEPDSVTGSITARIISLGIVVAIYEAHNYYFYLNFERCPESWVDFNLNGLTSDIRNKVFGQHIAQKIVIEAVKDHIEKQTPTKALLMSFHGCTGCGKNFISSIISKNLLRYGGASKYFHLYLERDFNQEDKISEYKKRLKSDIKKATESCQYNLFVFDEVDKMVPGVLDALHPFVRTESVKEGRDYRKNIFIFLSNAGAADINRITLKFLTEGKHRHSIDYNDVGPLIPEGAFNEVGGLKNSGIIQENLIDLYVPFLPLERDHVKDCVKAELIRRNKNPFEAYVDEIVDQVTFATEGKVNFAVSGCKKVSAKVDLYLN